MYAELHVHTHHSNHRLPDCIIKTEDAIQYAFDLGLKAVSITDHECLSGHIKAIQLNKKLQEINPDFKVILGNEIYLIKSLDKEEKKKYYHFLLLAKDSIGHKYLRELSSKAWKQSYYDRRLERVPTLYSDFEEIVKEKGHLIGSTACLGGYFPTLVLKYVETGEEKYKYQIDDFVTWGINAFGQDDFYIEIQPGLTDEQIKFNKKAIQIAKFYNLKWIVTNDIHYLKKEDRSIHQAYLNSKDEERETSDFYESCYFKTEYEMEDRLSYLDLQDIRIAFDNTIDIYNKIEFFDLKQEVIVPVRHWGDFTLQHIFKNWYDKYEYINKFATSEYEQDLYLLYRIEQGFVEKQQEFSETNLARINEELETIWTVSEKLNQTISSYYNLTNKIIEIMWDDNLGDSLVGIARGSVTGMYIAYLIGITQINPIQHNLPAWRHLSADRPELPDIDIDTQQNRRQQIFNALKTYLGEENGLNIITFKTESSKSAVLTACRGLGIDIDIAQEIADMIPIERGKVWSINDCLYGNEEFNRKPIKKFIDKLEEYPLLRDTVLKIEGLICGRSIHASGFYVFNNGYIEQNALMKAPNGQLVTCWNMEDSDYAGGLKIDCLTIQALDKIRKTMELLIKDRLIEWQGSLRKTYNKYLHPDVIDYTTSEMWDLLGNNEAIDVFQFDTQVGSAAARLVKPRNLKEMSITNSLMRLSSTDDEQPLDKYIRFKNDINQWYKEMEDYGLTKEEMEILKKYLLSNYGLAAEQEDIMEISMDKHVANFTLKEANKLRKAVAKKKYDVLMEAKKMFFEWGEKAGSRELFLTYIWDYCIMLQANYAFSRNHTCPYSAIGLQELNLLYKHPQIYWNTACLTVNAAADEENEDNKNTNYGKIAKAIGEIQSSGIKVLLPDINKADFGFAPDIKNNAIIFGLKGITNIGDDIAFNIIAKRPYTSLIDFVEKTKTSKVATIQLIKGGVFDELENKNRIQIMKDYLTYLAQKEYKPKNKLTLSYLDKLNKLDLLGKDNDIYLRYYNFNKYITNKEFFKEKIGNKSYYIAKNEGLNFFEQHYVPKLKENVDYWYTEEGIVFCKSSYDKIYKKNMEWITNYINLPNIIDSFNQKLCDNFIEENWSKYCTGNISSWEMDALSFYYHAHELSNINKTKYNITDFNDISETPVIESYYVKKGKEFPKYRLYKIVGTVLDRDKNKHIVTLLTPNGVVNVKFYSGAFIHYDKTISQINNDKKEIIDRSWFKRGTKLMICGIRRGENFIPKKYFDSIYNHTVCLIEDVINDELVLRLERKTQ